MSTSLSRLVDALPEIHKKECKVCKERRKIKSVYNFILIQLYKNKKLDYECKECKKSSLKQINELIKRFPNVYQLFNGDTNKSVLLL